MDLKCSPAQDALIRVHSRLAEVRFEPGASVTARLLVHSQHIGCLLGKGGIIITEMRRLTGASIRIFDRENGLNFKTQNDELVQVIFWRMNILIFFLMELFLFRVLRIYRNQKLKIRHGKVLIIYGLGI